MTKQDYIRLNTVQQLRDDYSMLIAYVATEDHHIPAVDVVDVNDWDVEPEHHDSYDYTDDWADEHHHDMDSYNDFYHDINDDMFDHHC